MAAENATLAATVEAQRRQVEALKQRVVTLSRMLFGTSSEKEIRAGGMTGRVLTATVMAARGTRCGGGGGPAAGIGGAWPAPP